MCRRLIVPLSLNISTIKLKKYGILHIKTKVVDTLADVGCLIVAKADSYKGCTDVGVALATKSVNW